MIPSVCWFKNAYEITSNINKNQTLCFIDLFSVIRSLYKLKDSGAPFKPYFWLPFHSNFRIVQRHYLKTNIHINKNQFPSSLKNLKEALTLSSLVIYFFITLTNFRHLVLQSTRKLNPKFFQKRNFANKMGIFLQFKSHFHDQSFFSVIVNIVGTRNSLKKEDW